jgi:hypothetical protein
MRNSAGEGSGTAIVDAIGADVVLDGAKNRVSLVIVSEGRRFVIVRMNCDTLARLRTRIGTVLSPRRLYSVSRR